ncbi:MULTISPECIES: CidA/LrgA family protein [Pandoraea]|uniref:CidA/LrgA family protein n=1 Tax=Pandoraea TaxID=93217 RepID=UPI001F5CAE4D|nr:MULTISPECIES: CidA/LrgA family protein [Pandoraea]MCI3206383.1 CidA/LrgA family protein [Pandoraea sp. LA3]MDN4584411.1 CidA/LrgA family protein [Pandoraea capi]
MINALSILIGAQLLGEVLRQLLHLPLPGPVIGMFLLAGALLIRQDANGLRESQLTRVADTLITNMGLLFVPAGVGIVTEGSLLRQYWLPILIGLILSTLLGLLATAWVMHVGSQRLKRSTNSEIQP